MGGIKEELLVNIKNHLEITHILGMKHIFPLINKVLSGGLNTVQLYGLAPEVLMFQRQWNTSTDDLYLTMII